ncbi:hypothetical protein M8C21_019298 [Ambrosia artemisiifolia]|uniref:Uncharacterized protein n=1 Tax=Ambrosia artemisiifolia TaxID=4212 RepID=A0AAD5GZB3_AMBAR|nr:hypothetical protein M8C21_019298 [Ambrosia artemisiifolia]
MDVLANSKVGSSCLILGLKKGRTLMPFPEHVNLDEVLKCEYAVRGEIVSLAQVIE